MNREKSKRGVMGKIRTGTNSITNQSEGVAAPRGNIQTSKRTREQPKNIWGRGILAGM
ncbi:unnamed protein product [Pocillopora meandrina]|uniref:Uncharacterized protein n=1 Tax=Pocillopora meandrina TaxID=46732 RepID=A0AAU9VWU8_9CNID|nr:unnamed protein product [Pocillopora meandrina]